MNYPVKRNLSGAGIRIQGLGATQPFRPIKLMNAGFESHFQSKECQRLFGKQVFLNDSLLQICLQFQVREHSSDSQRRGLQPAAEMCRPQQPGHDQVGGKLEP